MRLRSGAAVLLAAAFFLASPLGARAATAAPDLASYVIPLYPAFYGQPYDYLGRTGMLGKAAEP
jgi:hypothetical protein